MRPHNFIISLAVCVLSIGLLISPPSQAQTYSSWDNPDAPSQQNSVEGNAKLKELVDSLNKLIDQAELDRAANPMFLNDLRDLANGFDRPWTQSILFDDFVDGDYTNSPVWTVSKGRYWIEKGWGLRNAIDKAEKATSSSGTTTKSKDAAAVLFGQILNKALGGSGSSTTSGTNGATTSGIQPTSIYHTGTISNAFALEIEISSWINKGLLVIGPYQGTQHESGYRLTYNVGGSIELSAKSNRGVRIIDQKKGPFILEDKKAHTLNWTRDAQGLMVVTLDGEKLFELTDNSFQDSFEGFGMGTKDGDFIIKRINILGTQ